MERIVAYFAELNTDGIVIRIMVVRDVDILDSDLNESEPVGVAYCRSLFDGNWVQTSSNNSFRKQPAGIGYSYNRDADVFITPCPYKTWVLNADFDWEATVAKPADGKQYYWNEDIDGWGLIPYSDLPPKLAEITTPY
jgi:hypothetical protein